MKKTLLLLCSVIPGVLFAQRTMEQSRELAMKLLNQNVSSVNVNDTRANGVTRSNSLQSYYIFNGEEQGFAIVNAKSTGAAILGYSMDGSFSQTDMPTALSYYLDLYSEGKAEYKQAQAQKYTPVAPLLKTKWGQGYPYNSKCPTVNGVHVPTGCVATSTAQLMNYWKHPQTSLKGKHNYDGIVTDGDNSIRKTYDLSEISFDWDNMADEYLQGEYTDAQADAVSQLMWACGLIEDMNYSFPGSGTQNYYALRLIEYGGYANVARHYESNNYYFQDWKNMVIKELQTGRPIIYGGADATSAHSFIFDGLDEDGKVHVNWGWTGRSDGYFDLSLLTPYDDKSGFSASQDLVAGLYPEGADTPAFQGLSDINLLSLTVDPLHGDANEQARNTWLSSNFKLFSASTPRDTISVKLSLNNTGCLQFEGSVIMNICKQGETTPVKAISADASISIGKTNNKGNVDVILAGDIKDLPNGTYTCTFHTINEGETVNTLKVPNCMMESLTMELTDDKCELTKEEIVADLTVKLYPIDQDTLYTLNYMPPVVVDITNNSSKAYTDAAGKAMDRICLGWENWALEKKVGGQLVEIGPHETKTFILPSLSKHLISDSGETVTGKVDYWVYVNDNNNTLYSDTLSFILAENKPNADGKYFDLELSCAQDGKTIAPCTDVTVHAKIKGYTYADHQISLSLKTPYLEKAISGGSNTVSYKPGEEKELDVVVNGSYKTEAPGEYTITVFDDMGDINEVLATYTFTVGDPTEIKELDADTTVTSVSKFVKNGKIIIIKNGVKYNVAGQRLQF